MILIKKQYVHRSIEGYRSPYADPFEYMSVAELGLEEVCHLMMPFVEIESAPDRLVQAKFEFETRITYAGSGYRAENWFVAFLADEPIGIVLPQRYWDHPEAGSIFYIGVLPEHQGKGYGKIIHAKGLEVLANWGAKRYFGNTEVTNAPMLAVFRVNGCQFLDIHTVNVDEQGRQWFVE